MTDIEFKESIKIFNSIFELINQNIKNKKTYKEDSNIYANYEAIKGSSFNASLNKLKDKSLKTAFINIVFNKSNPKEWRKERLHSTDDLFDYLTIENDFENVCDTSLAEVAERKLQNNNQQYLLINFINSRFKNIHPDIENYYLVTIFKNCNEQIPICIDGVDSPLTLNCWLEDKYSLSKLEYPFDTTIPPRDEQTILRETSRFKKTQLRCQSRIIYCELATERYWYIDNLHFGQAAHLEVFDKRGSHIGEADLQGKIDTSKQDKNKTINLS